MRPTIVGVDRWGVGVLLFVTYFASSVSATSVSTGFSFITTRFTVSLLDVAMSTDTVSLPTIVALVTFEIYITVSWCTLNYVLFVYHVCLAVDVVSCKLV